MRKIDSVDHVAKNSETGPRSIPACHHAQRVFQGSTGGEVKANIRQNTAWRFCRIIMRYNGYTAYKRILTPSPASGTRSRLLQLLEIVQSVQDDLF